MRNSPRSHGVRAHTRALRSALICLLPSLALPALLVAQEPRSGTVVGTVIEAASGKPLSDAGVQIVGTTLGTQSALDGSFRIAKVSAGTVTIQVRRLGFTPKTITGLMLEPGRTLQVDVTLASAAVQLTAQVVSAAAERGTVNEALDQQRNAIGVVSAVTREQISKSPDDDAAQAVQRVSGVTVQDGKYVQVRGLGERYTTASLNGSRLPSPEPERKVVPLDLFPSALIQSVTTSKTFTPDQPGDFSGASVDIRTREFPATRQLSYTLNLGFNSGATGSRIPYAPGVGGEAIAMAGSSRFLPAELRAAGNFEGGVSRDRINGFIRSFRNVWRAPQHEGVPARSASLALGGNDPLFGHHVGYVVSGTYSYGEDVKADRVRARAIGGTGAGGTTELDRFVGTTASSSVLWGGVANFSTLLGQRSKLTWNNTYDRSADNEAREERGSIESIGLTDAYVERLQYVQRSVGSSQLAGEHQIGSTQKLDWAVTGSMVSRDEPDRSQIGYQIDRDAQGREVMRWLNLDQGAVRTFASLDESSVEARGAYALGFGAPEREHRVKVGGLYRATNRFADNRSYNIFALNLSDSVRALPVEQLFSAANTAPGSTMFDLHPMGQGGTYDASDRLGAVYAMTELGLTDRLRAIGGARVEQSNVHVNALSTLGEPSNVQRSYTDVLPSLALDYALGESQMLRLAGSRTLARPEYREQSNVCGYEVLGGEVLCGNPDLVRTLIDNLDLRWELYPRSGEVLSVALFGKRFHDPIERVSRASSNESRTTFANAHGATNYGVELEARKRLDFVAAPLRAFTMFGNVTLMHSRIDLGDQRGASTNGARRMMGQAPYVVNAGLTYTSPRNGTSATLLFNRIGERIVAAGETPLPDVIELPRSVLDLSLRAPVWRGVAARFDAKNLLDTDHREMQGSVVREGWQVGRTFQVGMSWQP